MPGAEIRSRCFRINLALFEDSSLPQNPVKSIATRNHTVFSAHTRAASAHIDAMRGIAALLVFVGHWRSYFFVDYPYVKHANALLTIAYFVTGLGHEAVIIFFVLSGYLVGGSVLRQMRVDCWSWGSYLFARLTRLYLVLTPALLLGLLWDLWTLHHFGVGSAFTSPDLRRRLSATVMAGNYLFLQGILVPTFGTNDPLWSLSYEFCYYIAFPFMVIVTLKRLAWPRRVISAGVLFILGIFVGEVISLYFLIWLMGAALYFIPQLSGGGRTVRYAAWLAAFLALSGALIFDKTSHGSILNKDLYLGTAVSALLYVILCCARGPLSSPYIVASQHLARSSYTLYLVHVPIFVFLSAWLARQRIQPWDRTFPFVFAIGIGVFLYAQLVWWLFEARTESIRSWLKPHILGASGIRKTTTADNRTDVV
jgi:peptidoglycan/LPS O-acetylase OafA/YrhL